MFMGEYLHSLDKKGRIIMPARFRSELGEKYVESFVITRGFDNCLFVFPINEWKNFENKLKSLPLTDANTRYIIRILYSNATEASLDKQGRMFIPSDLRSKVNIDKDVVITGYFNMIEIWGKEKWDEYVKKETIEPFESIVQKLFDLGIMK
jgi:MraZ protein